MLMTRRVLELLHILSVLGMQEVMVQQAGQEKAKSCYLPARIHQHVKELLQNYLPGI